jgi:hypothetical protein
LSNWTAPRLDRLTNERFPAARREGESEEMTNETEFRRCQKCGQVEKIETHEIFIKGNYPDDCDSEVELWVRFKAPADWPPND